MQPVSSVPKEVDQEQMSFGRKVIRGIASLFSRHRKKKIAALILLIGAVIMFPILGNRETVISVTTGEVTKANFEQSIFATGKLEVKEKQEFYADSKTTIKEVLVKAGDRVKKGQVVLRTDGSSLDVQVSQNQLACDEIEAKIVNSQSNIRLFQQDYNLAQKDFHNGQTLYASGVISKDEFDEAEKKFQEAKEKLLVERDSNLPLLKSQLAQAQVVLKESREKLQQATVMSPMDGVVLSLPVKKGQEVEVGTLLAQIGNPTDLQVETGINEIDAARLKVGDKVEITSSALLDKPLSGSITEISPIAEVVTTAQGEQTQVKIVIAVDKSKEATLLKPGYNVDLKVILQQKDEAVLVSFEAVVDDGTRDIVFVVGEDGMVSEREVRTGLSNELFIEIISGVEVGEKVVLNPGEEIKDGIKVIADAPGK
jgi:HlyD family secretion protein